MDDIRAALVGLRPLPSYRQVFDFIDPLSTSDITVFCVQNELYQLLNTEFVDGLSRLIRTLEQKTGDDMSALEICAGTGKLSYHLQERGIQIIPTDTSPVEETNRGITVERLSHKAALEKYNPQIVIASWIPYHSKLGEDVLRHPSVRYFIEIGAECCGVPSLASLASTVSVKTVEEYGLCRTDYHDGMYHTNVKLHTPKRGRRVLQVSMTHDIFTEFLPEALTVLVGENPSPHLVREYLGHLNTFWDEADLRIEEIGGVHKVYQDSTLTRFPTSYYISKWRDGKDKSRNYAALLRLITRGAKPIRIEEMKTFYAFPSETNLRDRDECIASRINATLRNYETGLLFMGASHHVDDVLRERFPDIELECFPFPRPVEERLKAIVTELQAAYDSTL